MVSQEERLLHRSSKGGHDCWPRATDGQWTNAVRKIVSLAPDCGEAGALAPRCGGSADARQQFPCRQVNDARASDGGACDNQAGMLFHDLTDDASLPAVGVLLH